MTTKLEKAKTRNDEILKRKKHDLNVKVILLGEQKVGKTSLMVKYLDRDTDVRQVTATIGVDIKNTTLKVGKRSVELRIWDTAGQERFHSLNKIYYMNTHGVALVFDITDLDSFKTVPYWREVSSSEVARQAVFILVGTKTDLKEKRRVSSEEAQTWAQQHGMKYIETSAYNDHNISRVFEELVHELVDKRELWEKGEGASQGITLQNEKSRFSRFKSRCC